MSWRLLTKHLRDGPRTTGELCDLADTSSGYVYRWVRDGIDCGAIRRIGVGRYELTAMGVALLENRVEFRRIGGRMLGSVMAWHATWMQPLPRYAEDVFA